MPKPVTRPNFPGDKGGTLNQRAFMQVVGKGAVHCGKCEELLPSLRPGGLPAVKGYAFTFADPPFNIGQKYEGYCDRISKGAYREWTENWLSKLWDATDGVMALHGPDSLCELFLVLADKLGFAHKRIAWVNWHYRFGQCGRGNWIDSRCHCLIFAKRPKYTWNPASVLVDSDRATKYGDKRIHETVNGGQRVPFTVWGIPSDGEGWGRVQGGNRERVKGSPNQLPELYLARLIKAYTNEGDYCLDPFGGTGTTVTVATALGRFCDTIELSEPTCKLIVERLKKGAVRV